MADPAPPSFPQLLFQPEPGACQILLVRHGQSAPFVPGQTFPLVDGHGDPPLTELGHHQAQLVARRLAGEPIRAIYVSSLTRTHQTAAPLADRLGLTPQIEPDLREVFLGEGEGGRFRQMSSEEHPAVLRMRANQEWGEVPGAESNTQLRARTVAAVERIAAANPDRMVAVFCHGGVIASLVGHVVSANPFAFHGARHTSVSHLVVNPSDHEERWILRSFNDGAHAGTLTTDHQVPS
jgi:2,3-bisphosphoglycerate-dependent phosphoglycerate mutase